MLSQGSFDCMPLVTVFNKTSNREIAARVEVADTSLRRIVGLLGRDNLAPEEGLWINPSSGVHTVGMSFAIDVLGLDKHFSIVRMWSNLAPYRLTALNWNVRSVIELPAGRIAERNIQLADTVVLMPHSAAQPSDPDLS
jgi:uncharacterized protein